MPLAEGSAFGADSEEAPFTIVSGAGVSDTYGTHGGHHNLS